MQAIHFEPHKPFHLCQPPLRNENAAARDAGLPGIQRPARSAAGTAVARSASSSRIVAPLPPSSSTRRFIVSSALRCTMPCPRVRPCEADRGDIRVRGQDGTHLGSGAGHDVEDTLRQSGAVQDAGQNLGLQGALLGGFDDKACASADRMRELCRDESVVAVPWRDRGQDAGRQHLDRGAPDLPLEVIVVNGFGHSLKDRGGVLDREAGELRGRTVFLRHRLGHRGASLANGRGETSQHPDPLGLAGRCHHRLAANGRGDGAPCVLRIGKTDMGKGFLGRWIDQRHALCPMRRHEGTVDVDLVDIGHRLLLFGDDRDMHPGVCSDKLLGYF